MAPLAKSSLSGAGIGKKVHRKRSNRREPSDSWALLQHQGMNPSAGDIPVNDHNGDHSPSMDSPTDVMQTVEPLRELAERVGNEVEEFARELDLFLDDLPTRSDRFDFTFELVKTFEDMSKGAETDIWGLFCIMLKLHPLESDAEALQAEREEVLARLGQPHRYSTEAELWERFIEEDDLARERYQVKRWLETTTYHQQGDIHGTMESLEGKAGRGKGLWSSGWLDTREKIKGEKTKRNTWPDAEDSPLPQIRRADNNELLITTLDPDAPSRQQRAMEKPDIFSERAIWTACWEMIRRGTSLEDVCSWCEEHREGWRALAMGQVSDSTHSIPLGSAWRHMCQVASQSGCSSEYEAAVFGVLGGNVKAVEKVCRTVDDHLYAFYSAALLHQFDQYLLAVAPDKAVPLQWRRGLADDSLQDPEQAESAINELINKLRQGPATKSESKQPMKIIQSYLLADQVGSLIHTVGATIAETASLQGLEDMFLRTPDASQNGVSLPEVEVGLDPQTLRIAAHMAIVYRVLNPDQLEGDEVSLDENVLVAYIQALRTAGKRDSIPLYASRLQRERYIIVLARVLQDVTDSQEQARTLQLMQTYDLDIVAILTEQLNRVLDESLGGEALKKPIRILESTADKKFYPGQRIIKGFLPDEIMEDDDAVVASLYWFQLMDGGWKVMFEALSVALRRCLVTGRVTCARMIVQKFPHEDVSLRKSYETIGRSVNLMENTLSRPDDEQEALSWELMIRQSRTYFELAQLVHAVESLSEWRTEEDKYLAKAPKPSGVPSALKRARADVQEAMQPILKGILLHPIDDEEAEDLNHIRNTYLPEIVIAYNTVLHAAGNLITRDCLLESMELANVIAKSDVSGGESNGLEEAFAQSGRMRELVESFALTSKVMLVLKAEGKPWKPRKDRVGRDLGMWELGSLADRGVLGGEES